jgi:uncharacterized RDD family membrane protein YckC
VSAVAGAVAAAAPRPAGFWRRLAAWLIDAWVLVVVFQVIDLAVGALSNGRGDDVTAALTTALWYAYFTVMLGRRGQTVGCMLLGVRLARRDGGVVGYGRALVRTLLITLSLVLCLVPALISALTTAFGARKLALHDMILDTRMDRV